MQINICKKSSTLAFPPCFCRRIFAISVHAAKKGLRDAWDTLPTEIRVSTMCAQDFCEVVQHLFFFDDIPDLDI